MDKKLMKAAAAVAAAGTALYAADKWKKKTSAQKSEETSSVISGRDYGDRQVYIIGGGLAGLSAAAWLIRDAGFSGDHIHIYEAQDTLGGSADGCGSNESGFVCRGQHLLNEETFLNFFDLFSSIPSLDHPDISVSDEIRSFREEYPIRARARLVDRDANLIDVSRYGFDNQDRLDLTKLLFTREESLEDKKINEWFGPHFFTTNFWYLWQTTFAFKETSGVFEFRRFLNSMMNEFPRMDTMEGITRFPFNPYESMILPLAEYLKTNQVELVTGRTVTEIDFDGELLITANALHFDDGSSVSLSGRDLCLFTNACMADACARGDLHTPAPEPEKLPISNQLWTKAAAQKACLGNPFPFFSNPEETNWETFTITMHGDKLLKMLTTFSGNEPGTGGFITFRDSPWLASLMIPAQPYFREQADDITVLWGNGLNTNVPGEYVKKTMRECTGEEILHELICSLHWDECWEDLKADLVNVIPSYMPYASAQYMPHKKADRPPVVPNGSTNFAMIGQFTEIPDGMVFTEEYSVRSARIAVYQLLDIALPIAQAAEYWKKPDTLVKATQSLYR